MKKLSELKISPAPWNGNFCGRVEDANGEFVANSNNPRVGEFIAAAPDMYVALRKITEEQECGKDCAKCNNHGCVIKECKAALAKAAGEEVAK